MWFIGVEVEQETSAPPPKKKSWIRPYRVQFYSCIERAFYHSITEIKRFFFQENFSFSSKQSLT